MDKSDSQPASINDFERAVLARNYIEAEQLIVKLIRLYGKDKIALTLAPFDRNLTQEQADLESYQALEKLACAITCWFSDPNWQPNAQFFSFITMQKNFLGHIFAASSYHSMDHIAHNLGLMGKANYTKEEIIKILLVFTIESDIELPWTALLQHVPNETAQAFSGIVASIGIQLSERAQRNISALLAATKSLPTIQTDKAQNLGPLIKAFFNCSSLADPQKYNLKQWVTRSIDQYSDNYITPALKKRLKKDVKKKPFLKEQTVLFIHEKYRTKHAMYRSWHALIKKVKERYNTVSLSMEKALDDNSKKDFHNNIEITDEWDIVSIAEKVMDVKPDVIVYSSIGMSVYGIFLATLRLAPVQIVLPGHPSSSYLKNIDYLVSSREGLTDEEMSKILTEKWLPIADGPGQVALVNSHIDYKKQATKEFKIAVNGVIQKVSHQLVKSCQRITQQAKTPVKFVFFMAHPKQDLEYYAAKSILRRYLPNSEIKPFVSYQRYMECLTECKFAISTFPFGGSNSNVDLIRVGIPKLFIEDRNDFPGIADLQLWKGVNQTYGYCDSVEQLEARAVELINNPEELALFTQKIEDIDLYNTGLSADYEKQDNRLVDAITSAIELNQ